MAGAGDREVARCDKGDISWPVAGSTLRALDVWTRKVSWQAQGSVRL